jgi:hypothetical protein
MGGNHVIGLSSSRTAEGVGSELAAGFASTERSMGEH